MFNIHENMLLCASDVYHFLVDYKAIDETHHIKCFFSSSSSSFVCLLFGNCENFHTIARPSVKLHIYAHRCDLLTIRALNIHRT